MKIAICADSHDNFVNTKKFLNYCQTNNIAKIIHCGDWNSLDIIKLFNDNFAGEIIGVLGNADINPDEILSFTDDNKNFEIEPKTIQVSLNNLNIFVTHTKQIANYHAENKNYDFVFYGHNHKPWLEKINKTYLVNPGTLAGLFNKASFAIYNFETKKIELKLLDSI